MSLIPRLLFLFLFLCLVAGAATALGDLVSYPLPLAQLEAQSDLIFKGEAVAVDPVFLTPEKTRDVWHKREVRFRVISVIKGQPADGEIRLRLDAWPDGAYYMPPAVGMTGGVEFKQGEVYLVSARKSKPGEAPLSGFPSAVGDEGAMRCLDRNPVKAKTLRQIYWAELLALRDSPVTADILYAIGALDRMSEPGPKTKWSMVDFHTPDFDRVDVLSAVHALVARPEKEVALAAIQAVGASSPYLHEGLGPQIHWTNGQGEDEPAPRPQEDAGNAGGVLCWRELAAVAKGNGPAQVRALAIRALARTRGVELRPMVQAWLKAPAPEVRAAAVMVYGDLGADAKHPDPWFARLSLDPSPVVRKNVAYSIAWQRHPALAPVLAGLLKDADKEVRDAAAESLLTFRPNTPAVAAAFGFCASLPGYQSQCLLALAREDPAAHAIDLARWMLATKPVSQLPENPRPVREAWDILLKYLETLPVRGIDMEPYDVCFDALEKIGFPDRNRCRRLYTFYQDHNALRADKYRVAAVAFDRSLAEVLVEDEEIVEVLPVPDSPAPPLPLLPR